MSNAFSHNSLCIQVAGLAARFIHTFPLLCHLLADLTKTAFAVLVVDDGCKEVLLSEVGPENGGEI